MPHVQVSAETDSVCSCFLLSRLRCHGYRASPPRHASPLSFLSLSLSLDCWVIQPISWLVSSPRWSFKSFEPPHVLNGAFSLVLDASRALGGEIEVFGSI